VQLDQAGIKVAGPTDKISDEAKLELLILSVGPATLMPA